MRGSCGDLAHTATQLNLVSVWLLYSFLSFDYEGTKLLGAMFKAQEIPQDALGTLIESRKRFLAARRWRPRHTHARQAVVYRDASPLESLSEQGEPLESLDGQLLCLCSAPP